MVLQPFIEDDNPVLRLFPPRFYAILIPTLAGVVLFSATLGVLGYILIASQTVSL
jgi:Dolichol phosphate-mannose biosynthesis regulatory protein (DPM2)